MKTFYFFVFSISSFLGGVFSFGKTELTLSEAGAAKIMCDAYFTRKFKEMAKTRKAQSDTEPRT